MIAQYEAALAYRESGRFAIPLDGKRPLVAGWAHRASPRASTLRRWFVDEWPGANVGLRTGDGLIAIDIDPRNGGDASFRSLVGTRPFPAGSTASALTGGGGVHYWLSVPGPVGCFAGLDGLPGLDVKGTGGQVAVEPSIHPETSRSYVWTRPLSSGVADCPAWLYRELTKGHGGPGDFRASIGAGRAGDVASLASALIARFPVPGPGRRNDLMVRCVASLAGRGFGDETVTLAVGRWWAHFHALGAVGTHPSAAPVEVRKTLAVLRKSGRFGRSLRHEDHMELCRKIELGLRQICMIAGRTPEDGRRPDGGPGNTNTKSVTLIPELLCVSGDDRAFVGALIVHAMHKAEVEPAATISMTHAQIRDIVALHWPEIGPWDNKQFERLKAKYVGRPRDGKPATRHEMLSEVEKGDRRPGQSVGTPSIYIPTGIVPFLEES